MNKTTIHILLFEDNPGDARLLREFLREDHTTEFELDHVDRLESGLAYLGEKKPDIILLDLGYPIARGWKHSRMYAPWRRRRRLLS